MPTRPRTRSSGATCRAGTSTPAPSTGPRPRWPSACSPAWAPSSSGPSPASSRASAGGWIDGLISRVSEVFAGLPFILGGIVILTTFNRPGQIVGEVRIITQVVLTIVVLSWPLALRIMRAAALEASQQDYVTAARALGAGPLRIVGRHILPNTLAPVLVFATIQFGVFIGAEAALSFLGVGLRDPVVSWGVMISEAQERVTDIPQALFFPAAFLVVVVLAFVMLGDAVRDAFDPRGR